LGVNRFIEYYKMQKYPKFSIITPSFNQGAFLEQTILSVIGQRYPNLEYIIMDGGSTDNSVEIIKRYEKYITYWVSEQDNGQADAINKGFEIATGEILGWLNSDDYYLPETLNFVSDNILGNENEILFGNCFHFQENAERAYGSNVYKNHSEEDLLYVDYLIQPASFWTKVCWDKVGKLDTDSNYVFDWKWFIRAKLMGVNFKPVSRYLSCYRIHDNHKTGTGGEPRKKEIAEVYREYLGEEYMEYFNHYLKSHVNLKKSINRIDRLHLRSVKNSLLKILYPKLYKIKDPKIKLIHRMI
jgi:glycosyltransferase involved in cell wall biosynthesis